MPKSIDDLSDIEFSKQMSRREVVYERPTRWWQDGLNIGNGDLGAAVFGGGPESNGVIGVTLSKIDVWDERYDRKGHRYHTLAELRELVAQHAHTEEGRRILNSLEPYGLIGIEDWYRKTYPYSYAPPTPKPLGLVRIDPGVVFEQFESRLSIHRAEATFALGDAAKGASVSIYIDANSNVLVVQMERHGSFAKPITLELARYVDEQLGEPEVEIDENGFWQRYVFPDGFTYGVYGLVSEGRLEGAAVGLGQWRDVQAQNGWIRGQPGMRNWDVEIEAQERRATLTLAPDVSRVALILGAGTSKEAADALSLARELAQAAAERGVNAVREAHVAWWDGFWRKSSLILSDQLVEALWYQGLYALSCQSRGSIPPPLVGPGYYLPHAGWNGHYLTDFNIQMMYWPVFASNHLELAETYFDLFLRNIDTIKAETKTWYDIDGCKFPGLFIGDCRELGYLPTRNWQCGGAWAAQLYWWRYLYTGDVKFLREVAYPIMREVAKFYRAYALMGEDGKYHIFPSTPPEQPPWWATDPAIDLAFIRVHMMATLEASEILGLDEELRAGWQDLLHNLAEIPNDGEVILDHRDAPPDSKLGHAGLMSPVFSAGLIGLGSSPEEQALALRSLRSVLTRTGRMVIDYPFDIPTWNDDCNWPYLIACAARLGLAEDARAWIYDYGIFQHLKPNGLFAFDCPLNDEQRETRWGMPDSSHAFTAAVSEMLLQSYEGIIRVGPALPADWDACFAGFLAVGAFEVDAEITQGRVRRLSVLSLKGNYCRVHNPWPGEAVELREGGVTVPFEEMGGVIGFGTEPGKTYVMTVQGEDAASAEFEVVDVRPAPLSYVGPAFMGQVRDDDRIPVWLGLPARAT